MKRNTLASLRQRTSKPLDSLVARNIASSFIALTWLSLLSMLTIPIYVRLLGVSEWGLVAACATLQIVANFLDAGFSQIVPRWVAQNANNPVLLYQHIRLFRRVYLGIGLFLLTALQLSADYLATQWFQVSADRTPSLELAIRIVAIQIFCQFINNLHIGIWQGLQKQTLANVRICAFATAKHGLAIAAFNIWHPEVWIYATCFAIVATLEVATNANTIKNMTAKQAAHPHPSIPLQPILKEVSIISGGILIGALVSHLDRIVLSRSIDIEIYGIYTITVTLAAAFQQLNTPLTKTYLPLFVQDIETNNGHFFSHLKHLVLNTILFAIIPIILAIIFAPLLLKIWLHDPLVAATGTFPLRLLLFAIVLGSLYGCIHHVILATKNSKQIIKFNLLSLFAVALLIVVWPSKASIELGGAIWITNTLVQLAAGLLWLRKLNPVPKSE